MHRIRTSPIAALALAGVLSMTLAGPAAGQSSGTPTFWDTAWSLPNESTPEQVEAYFDYLATEGFAGTWISLVPFNWQGGMNQANYAGQSLGSFSNPNEQYLAHVEFIIDAAAARGLDVAIAVAWATDYTAIHPGTWANDTTFRATTDRFESCHPDPYSIIGAGRAAALPPGYFTPCDPNNASDPRNQKAYNYGLMLGNRWKTKPNVLWVMGGDYWDSPTEDLAEHTWIKMVNGLRVAGATQDVTYQPGGYSASWNNFAGDPWLDVVSFNHHCLQADQLEIELAALNVYGKDVIASEQRYEDEHADPDGLTYWCTGAPRDDNVRIGAAEIIADAQAALNAGSDAYVYGHDQRWAWDQGDRNGNGVVNALDSLGDDGEKAALALLRSGTQVAMFDQASGRWHMRTAGNNAATFFFGVPGDIPLLGDWDCNGLDSVGVFRPSTGRVLIRNSNNLGVADRSWVFGNPGDVPLVGDWNGNGCDTLAVNRNGRIFVSNVLGAAVADLVYSFGVPGDRPFTADFDGDGKTTVGVHRETSGFVYFRNDLVTGVAEEEFFYGIPSDRIVAGDWDDDGDETVGIFRPPVARFFLSNVNDTVVADMEFDFGSPGWLPLAGRW